MNGYLRKGDCIHIALPLCGDPVRMAASVTNGYEQLGIRVFMVDHVQGLTAPTIVSVVRGVPPRPLSADSRKAGS